MKDKAEPLAAHSRQPRSFVRRTGRVTRSQARALQEEWLKFGVPVDNPLMLNDIFGRSAPCFVEIGFGMGDSLADLAQRQPEHNFIGIEVHEAGIGRLLSLLSERAIGNVRVLRGDAVEALECCFSAASLAGVLVFFPDPWPKKRHHKRRLIQAPFVSLVASRLVQGGTFRLATDWAEYAQQMLTVIDDDGRWCNTAGAQQFLPNQFMQGHVTRPSTKFEKRGQRLGHEIYDLCFERL